MQPPPCAICTKPAKRRQRLFQKWDKTCGPDCARLLKRQVSEAMFPARGRLTPEQFAETRRMIEGMK